MQCSVGVDWMTGSFREPSRPTSCTVLLHTEKSRNLGTGQMRLMHMGDVNMEVLGEDAINDRLDNQLFLVEGVCTCNCPPFSRGSVLITRYAICVATVLVESSSFESLLARAPNTLCWNGRAGA